MYALSIITEYLSKQHHIKKLPTVTKPFEKRVRRFVIGDSIEGWSAAVKVLIKAYLGGKSDIVNGVEKGPAIVNPAGQREQVIVTHTASASQAGSASGTLYYFVADEKDGAESA